MSDVIGRNVAFGFQKEVVRGTLIQSAIKWIGKLDFDFKPVADTVQNESGFNHIAKANQLDIIRRSGAGGLTSKVFDKNIGDLMVLAFGQAPTSTPVSGDVTVYDHTFALLNSNSHASYSLFTVEGDIKQTAYTGAIMDETTIDVVTDDYAKVSTSFMSRKGSMPAALTPAYTDENEFLPKHVVAKFAAVGSDMTAAAATADVTEAHITISKNPVPRPTIGSDDVDPRNTVIEVSGEVHMYYNATTFRDYRDNQTKLAMRLFMANTDVTIGTSKNPSFTIDIPYIKIMDWDPDYSIDDLVQQTIKFTGLLNVATGAFLTATVRNLATVYN